MVEYKLKVEIVNETDYEIVWIGSSNWSDLNGATRLNNGTSVPTGETKITEISNNGTKGLITSLSWFIRRKYPQNSLKFSVYCQMPVTVDSPMDGFIGGRPTFVGLRDVSVYHLEYLTQNFCTDYVASHMEEHQKEWSNLINKKGVDVSVHRIRSNLIDLLCVDQGILLI